MNKLFKVTVEYGLDEEYGGDAHRYETMIGPDGKVLYDVRNFTYCPEDAIIARDQKRGASPFLQAWGQVAHRRQVIAICKW